MFLRSHTTTAAASVAQYSDCEQYRYSLSRTWDPAGPRVMFLMLNPSTADEISNDPTVERCEQRSRRLGYGSFEVTNIFAWRATDPRDMRKAQDPVGPMNDAVILQGAAKADRIIAAWGVHGAHLARGTTVADLLHRHGYPLYHLGLSKDGHPRHPLYLPYARAPEVWGHAAG